MKYGHLLKCYAQETELPATALLNYKKLKKLIKAQQQHKEAAQGPEPSAAAAATAASAEAGGGSSDEEEFPPSTSAETAAPASQPEAGRGAAAAPAGATAPAAAAAAAAEGAAAAAAQTPEGGAAQVAAGAAGAAAAPPAAAQLAAEADVAVGGVAEEDREFIQTLNKDLSHINSYFMEREEEAVIRLRALQDARGAAGAAAGAAKGGGGGAAAAAAAAEELEELRSEMVDFHGELVLLLHWSLVNYAAVAKILKKHDKLTGSRLRAPVLASVLHQPFLSTESISQLVKEAERHVQELTAMCGGVAAATNAEAEAAEGSAEVGRAGPEAAMLDADGAHVAIFKRTRAALHMLSDMQETASTPSTLLPPSTANSDAAPDGKKLRVGAGAGSAAEPPQRQPPSAQHPQPSGGSQQQQQSPLEVQAH